jgi:hypothetical protein
LPDLRSHLVQSRCVCEHASMQHTPAETLLAVRLASVVIALLRRTGTANILTSEHDCASSSFLAAFQATPARAAEAHLPLSTEAARINVYDTQTGILADRLCKCKVRSKIR